MNRWLILMAALCSLGATHGPVLTVRSFPQVGLSPLTVRVEASLNGLSKKLYCPGVEWVWGDGTTTTWSEDCSPWEEREEKEIQIRWSRFHTYRYHGEYRVTVNLVKNRKILLTNYTTVYNEEGGFEP